MLHCIHVTWSNFLSLKLFLACMMESNTIYICFLAKEHHESPEKPWPNKIFGVMWPTSSQKYKCRNTDTYFTLSQVSWIYWALSLLHTFYMYLSPSTPCFKTDQTHLSGSLPRIIFFFHHASLASYTESYYRTSLLLWLFTVICLPSCLCH